MFHAISIALGLALVVLWMAGIETHATILFTWLVGFAGLIAVAVGLELTGRWRADAAAWVLLAFGLGGLWFAGVTSGGTRWLAWATFVVGCCFLVLAVTCALAQGRGDRRMV